MKLVSVSRRSYELVAKNQTFQTSIYKWGIRSTTHSVFAKSDSDAPSSNSLLLHVHGTILYRKIRPFQRVYYHYPSDRRSAQRSQNSDSACSDSKLFLLHAKGTILKRTIRVFQPGYHWLDPMQSTSAFLICRCLSLSVKSSYVHATGIVP